MEGVWNVIKHTCFPLFGQMLAYATHSMDEINCCRQRRQVDGHSKICVIKIYIIKYKCQNSHALKHSVLNFQEVVKD